MKLKLIVNYNFFFCNRYYSDEGNATTAPAAKKPQGSEVVENKQSFTLSPGNIHGPRSLTCPKSYNFTTPASPFSSHAQLYKENKSSALPASESSTSKTIRTINDKDVSIYRPLEVKDQQFFVDTNETSLKSSVSKQDEYFLPTWEGVKLSMGRSLTSSTTSQLGGRRTFESSNSEKRSVSSILHKYNYDVNENKMTYLPFTKKVPESSASITDKINELRSAAALTRKIRHEEKEVANKNCHSTALLRNNWISTSTSSLNPKKVHNSRYTVETSAPRRSRTSSTTAQAGSSSDDDDYIQFSYRQKNTSKQRIQKASTAATAARTATLQYVSKRDETDSDSSSGWSMICEVGGCKSNPYRSTSRRLSAREH